MQNLIEKLTMRGMGPRTRAQQTKLPPTIQEEKKEEKEEEEEEEKKEEAGAMECAIDGDVKKYQVCGDYIYIGSTILYCY